MDEQSLPNMGLGEQNVSYPMHTGITGQPSSIFPAICATGYSTSPPVKAMSRPSMMRLPESIIPRSEELKTILLEAEREIYENIHEPDIPLFEKQLKDVHIQEYRYQEERLLSRNDLSRWLTATYKFTGIQADIIIALFQDLAVPWTTRRENPGAFLG